MLGRSRRKQGSARATDVDGLGAAVRFWSSPVSPVEIPPPDTPVHVVALPSPARVAADYVTRTRGITGDIEVDILVFAIPHNHGAPRWGLYIHTSGHFTLVWR